MLIYLIYTGMFQAVSKGIWTMKCCQGLAMTLLLIGSWISKKNTLESFPWCWTGIFASGCHVSSRVWLPWELLASNSVSPQEAVQQQPVTAPQEERQPKPRSEEVSSQAWSRHEVLRAISWLEHS